MQPTPEQIAACQEPGAAPLAYLAGERRMRRGERQWFCVYCERWRWPGTECSAALLARLAAAEAIVEATRASLREQEAELAMLPPGDDGVRSTRRDMELWYALLAAYDATQEPQESHCDA